MSGFRYRLQPLLDQKQREKDEAEHALRGAQEKLRREELELQSRRLDEDAAAGRLRIARLELVSPSRDGVTAEWIRIKRDHVERLREELDQACAATLMQTITVKQAEAGLIAARKMLAEKSLALRRCATW